jgi:hypothetical protein
MAGASFGRGHLSLFPVEPAPPSTSSLFGHLVTQFATSPENLATESLHYILRSATARSAGVNLLAQAATVELDQQYTFRTQVGGSDSAILGFVGFDSRGEQSLIIEASSGQDSPKVSLLHTCRVVRPLHQAPWCSWHQQTALPSACTLGIR